MLLMVIIKVEAADLWNEELKVSADLAVRCEVGI